MSLNQYNSPYPNYYAYFNQFPPYFYTHVPHPSIFGNQQQSFTNDPEKSNFLKIQNEKMQAVQSKQVEEQRSQSKEKYTLKVEEKEEISKSCSIQELQQIKSNINLMLETFYYQHKEYKQLYSRLSKIENDPYVCVLYRCLHNKLQSFKKTREEMVKYIIRKTQRHFKKKFQRKRDQRFIKFGKYKSMNHEYLKELFLDAEFAFCFDEVGISLKEEFKMQNQQRLNHLLEFFRDKNDEENMQKGIEMLNEKNKMPWPLYWENKLRASYVHIYRSYGTQKPEIFSLFENDE